MADKAPCGLPAPSSTFSPNAYSKLTVYLSSILQDDSRPALCQSVLPTIVDCIWSISISLRESHQISLEGTSNAFGDDQLNVDVISERIIRTAISKCPAIVTASSEESPVETPIGEDGAKRDSKEQREKYTLAFDPLDGSSIIAPNWTVGTIVGIWDGPSALDQNPKEKQIASVLGVYGPRTTAIIALRVPGVAPACFEVGLGTRGRDADCKILRTDLKLLEPPFKTRFFAPANLRAAAEDERYMQIINDFVKRKYTLRYSGGLVPDVVHILVKAHGVYLSPVTQTSQAKLRKLFEVAPIALIVECCGGTAIDPADGQPVLDTPISHCDERAGLICGSAEEVQSVWAAFEDRAT